MWILSDLHIGLMQPWTPRDIALTLNKVNDKILVIAGLLLIAISLNALLINE